MNTNPSAIRILCFGDSNTHGTIPGANGPRYDSAHRWTGLLQTDLGKGFEVIEEGLGGRTTALDHPTQPYKNGLPYFAACLDSHNPLDIVVIFLGTNDLQSKYRQSAPQIAQNAGKLVTIATAFVPASSILLIAPSYVEYEDQEANRKSRLLGAEYAKVSAQLGCQMIDLAPHIKPSPLDGVHFDEDGHQIIASLIEEKIKVMAASR